MHLRTLESRVFGALLLLTTGLFLWIVRDFLLPVFWAAVFAVLFWPLFVRLERRMGGHRGLAALVSTLTVVVVVVVPFVGLVAAVARQGLSLYERILSGEINLRAPIQFVERMLPPLSRLLAEYGVEVERIIASTETAAVSMTRYAAGQAVAAGQNTLIVAILFILMVYFLFFFFRDGERIVEGMIRAIPMGDERERRLFVKFSEVSRATVKGTLVVAAVQGVLGGAMFVIVDIAPAFLWGVVMGILSLLPAVGPALVWGPAAIVFLVTGAWGKAVFLIVGGSLVVGLVDNLLRPILIGRQAHMPDYLVLLATLGGIAAFGLAGFVAGPVIAALLLVMWEMFAEEHAPLDSSAPMAGEAPPAALAAPPADEPANPPPS